MTKNLNSKCGKGLIYHDDSRRIGKKQRETYSSVFIIYLMLFITSIFIKMAVVHLSSNTS